METFLGWVLSGCVEGVDETAINLISSTHVMRVEIDQNESLDKMVKKFWEIEGIDNSSSYDVNVYEKFRESVRFENGRYPVCLPWKDETEVLPDNFQLCKKLECLLKRLKKSPKLFQEYDEIIKNQISDGTIERKVHSLLLPSPEEIM